jgi:hypothetical protein
MDEKDDQIAHHRILAGREIPTNYGRNNNSPATPGSRHPLRFPLRQTEASKAQLWLQVRLDSHPPLVPVVGSKFASVQSRGAHVVVALHSDAGVFKLGTIFRQCAKLRYWGNP